MSNEFPSSDEQTGVLEKIKTKEPSLYKVLLLNDDYTPMDFVIQVLKKFFHKSIEDAETIMLQVHQQGQGVAGIYNLEIAETKHYQVTHFAEQHKHPLQCIIEKE